jgi:tyrosine-protein phosphatase SIW14
MNGRFRVLLTALLLLTAPAAARAEDAGVGPAIRRFEQVDTRLYRGGQPDAAAFAQLRQLGVRTIINLRHTDGEQEIAESLGFRYVALPARLHPFGIGGGLSSEVVRRFFQVIDDPASGPVFVHCRRGADRTGTLIAMYRIARQGWRADAAYREARASGLRWWHYQVKGFLEDVDRQTAAPMMSAAPVAP